MMAAEAGFEPASFWYCVPQYPYLNQNAYYKSRFEVIILEKIWIIHNTHFGNAEQVSMQIAEGLKSEYEVSVDHIKNITPEDIARDEPHGLISGFRIAGFQSDRKVRKFVSNVDKVVTKPIPKAAYFITHGMRWREFFFRGMKKTLKKIKNFVEICPDDLKVKMQTYQGPPEEGSDAKISAFIATLKEFLK